MKIKKGDTVLVISGKDKGKTAKVIRALPQTEQIILEGVNLKKKHQRARKQGQKGSMISVEHPIHVSNAMHIDSKTGKGTRKPASKSSKSSK
jgi:large subunit ribosomal protein L24